MDKLNGKEQLWHKDIQDIQMQTDSDSGLLFPAFPGAVTLDRAMVVLGDGGNKRSPR